MGRRRRPGVMAVTNFAPLDAPAGFEARRVIVEGCGDPECDSCRELPEGVDLGYVTPAEDPDSWLCMGPVPRDALAIGIPEPYQESMHKLAILFGAPWEIIDARPGLVGGTQVETLQRLDKTFLAWLRAASVDDVRETDRMNMEFIDSLADGERLRMALLSESDPRQGRN